MVHYNSSKVLSSEPCYCYGMIRNQLFDYFGRLHGVYYIFKKKKKLGGVFTPVLGIGGREAINFNFSLGDLREKRVLKASINIIYLS